MQPSSPTPGSTPGQYDFILNQGAPQPKNKLSLGPGSSQKQRIIVVAMGAVGLLIIGMVFMAILGSGSKSQANRLIELAQTQTEIVRIAVLAKSEKAVRSTDTLTFASTVELSVLSSQQQVIKMLPTGTKAGETLLAMKKNPKTDAALTAAAQNNTYDKVYVDTLKQLLTGYQQEIKTLYDSTSDAANKQTLNEAFMSAGLLLGQPAK